MDSYVLITPEALERKIKKCLQEVIEENDYKIQIDNNPDCKNAQSPKLVNIQEASEFTGYRVRTIYNLVNQKAIPFTRVRRSLRFDLNDLEKWMKSGEPKIIALGLKKLDEEVKKRS